MSESIGISARTICVRDIEPRQDEPERAGAR